MIPVDKSERENLKQSLNLSLQSFVVVHGITKGRRENGEKLVHLEKPRFEFFVQRGMMGFICPPKLGILEVWNFFYKISFLTTLNHKIESWSLKKVRKLSLELLFMFRWTETNSRKFGACHQLCKKYRFLNSKSRPYC